MSVLLNISNETEVELSSPSNLVLLWQVGFTGEALLYFDPRKAVWRRPWEETATIVNLDGLLALKAVGVDRLKGWDEHVARIYPPRA